MPFIGNAIAIGRRRAGVSKPAAPSALILTVNSDTEIGATGTNNAASIDGYSWEYSTDGVTYTEHGTSAGNTYTYDSLTAGTLYYFRFRVYKGSVYSEYCTVVADSTFIPEYAVIYDAFTVKPSTSLAKSAQNTLLKRIVDGEIIGDLDFFYLFGNHAVEDSLRNWLSPSVIVAQNIHETAYIPFAGYQSDGLNDYLKLGFIPSTAGNKYSLDSCSMGVYIVENSVVYNRFIAGSNSTADNYSIIAVRANSGPSLWVSANSAYFKTPLMVKHSIGLFGYSRNASNELITYSNYDESVGTTVSTSLSSRELYACAFNYLGTATAVSPQLLGAIFGGSKLTSIKIGIIRDALGEYFHSVGKSQLTIYFNGDSLTNASYASETNYWCKKVVARYSENYVNMPFAYNGIPGASLQKLVAFWGNEVYSPIHFTTAGKLDTIVVWEDVNSILNDGVSAAQQYTDMVSYFNTLRDYGFNVRILITSPYPRMMEGTYAAAWTAARRAAQKDYFNLCKNAVDPPWTDHIDLRDDAIIGGAEDQEYDPTYFYDWVHLVDAGYDRIHPYVSDIIDSYL